jgi:quercetin dioxygenase-like cupin family protein
LGEHKTPINTPDTSNWHHDSGKGGQNVFTAQLDRLELFESWSEEDLQIASKSAIVLSSREGSASTQVFYIVCEPHKRIGRHVHSAEEVLLVVEGTAEVSVGDEQARLSVGAMALIPAGVPHEPINVGSDTLRCVGYLSSATALHTWEVSLMPMEGTTFVTPPAEEGSIRVREDQRPRP